MGGQTVHMSVEPLVQSADDIVAEAREQARRLDWEGYKHVVALSNCEDATREHSAALAELCVRRLDGAGVSTLISAYLCHTREALDRHEIIECVNATAAGLARREGDAAQREQLERHERAGMLWWGLRWSVEGDDLRAEALEGLTREGPGPFREPFVVDGVNMRPLGEAAERALYGEGWWPALTSFVVSEATFDHLMGKVREGRLDLDAMVGVTSNVRRMTAVLEHTQTSGVDLSSNYVWRHYPWLSQEPAVLRRAVTYASCAGEALFSYPYRAGGDDPWGWVDDEWLDDLGTAACGSIARLIDQVGDEHGTATWRGSETMMRTVLIHAHGAAAAAGTESFAGRVLERVLDELFGEDREVARGLLNPATNLVELADVVGRL